MLGRLPAAALPLLLLPPVPALAQAQGAFPAVLTCDGADGRRDRVAFTLDLDGEGRAAYRLRLGMAPPETGTGRLTGRHLVLTGSAPGGYAARYAGEIRGTGGLLTGAHAPAKGGARRACQIVLGSG